MVTESRQLQCQSRVLGTLIKIVPSDKSFCVVKLWFDFWSPQKTKQMLKYCHAIEWIQINIVLEVGRGKSSQLAFAGVTGKSPKTLNCEHETLLSGSFSTYCQNILIMQINNYSR